jgi:hypothetical protein
MFSTERFRRTISAALFLLVLVSSLLSTPLWAQKKRVSDLPPNCHIDVIAERSDTYFLERLFRGTFAFIDRRYTPSSFSPQLVWELSSCIDLAVAQSKLLRIETKMEGRYPEPVRILAIGYEFHPLGQDSNYTVAGWVAYEDEDLNWPDEYAINAALARRVLGSVQHKIKEELAYCSKNPWFSYAVTRDGRNLRVAGQIHPPK